MHGNPFKVVQARTPSNQLVTNPPFFCKHGAAVALRRNNIPVIRWR
jgi:hypothetical protein